jgi:hypothetical protein
MSARLELLTGCDPNTPEYVADANADIAARLEAELQACVEACAANKARARSGLGWGESVGDVREPLMSQCRRGRRGRGRRRWVGCVCGGVPSANRAYGQVEAVAMFKSGDPKAVILDACVDCAIDVVALGARQLSALQRCVCACVSCIHVRELYSL